MIGWLRFKHALHWHRTQIKQHSFRLQISWATRPIPVCRDYFRFSLMITTLFLIDFHPAISRVPPVSADPIDAEASPSFPPGPSYETDEENARISNFDQTLAELESILSIVNQAILSFSPTIPLMFTHPPNSDSSPYLFPSVIPTEPNTGSLSLDPSFPKNASFLAHEGSMYRYLGLLGRYTNIDVPAVASVHARIRDLIHGEISRTCDVKGREWDAQRLGLSNVNIDSVQMLYKGVARTLVNCGVFLLLRGCELPVMCHRPLFQEAVPEHRPIFSCGMPPRTHTRTPVQSFSEEMQLRPRMPSFHHRSPPSKSTRSIYPTRQYPT